MNVGIEYRFKLSRKGEASLRFDVINLLDDTYELNDGTGIGEGAPKFGMRRGFFGGLSCNF